MPVQKTPEYIRPQFERWLAGLSREERRRALSDGIHVVLDDMACKHVSQNSFYLYPPPAGKDGPDGTGLLRVPIWNADLLKNLVDYDDTADFVTTVLAQVDSAADELMRLVESEYPRRVRINGSVAARAICSACASGRDCPRSPIRTREGGALREACLVAWLVEY